MATSVIMPQLGESVTEGTLVKWHKKEGEKVKKDEILYEISTDKVDSEIPSPVEGTLKEIKVHEGEKVPVKSEVALIEETKAIAVEAEKAKAKPGQAAEEETEVHPPEKFEIQTEREIAKAEEAIQRRGLRIAKPTSVKRHLSPLVRKLIKEHKVDVEQISGTGAGGRITKADVLSYLNQRRAEAIPAPPPIKLQKLSHMRKQIAEHMQKSVRDTAMVTNVVQVDMSAIAQVRNKYKEEFKKNEGFSLTYLPFVAKATTKALAEFPVLNAQLKDDEEVVFHKNINLGIAVSLDEKGLIVPVIKNAEEKSITGLARAINDLAKKARNKQLSVDEVEGGTFSITNQGIYGSLFSTPIINYPQTAILSLETVTDTVVAVDGQIAIRPMVFMPLTWDHRLIDGAIAAMFLQNIKSTLEKWDANAPII